MPHATVSDWKMIIGGVEVGPADAAWSEVRSPATGRLAAGMGSSRYAADTAALRLRARGLDAVAELASTEQVSPPGAGVLAVGISASGRSAETLGALRRHAGRSRTVAVTNDPDSELARMADQVVPLEAGPEEGGVACRSFQHTGLVLRALEAKLTGQAHDHARLCRQVTAASADLLERRAAWLPELSATLDGPDGVYVLAPAERWSSAAQSALMLREGPRRAASACETGDWCHVDVYLTKTLDDRALLLSGSRYDQAAMDWLRRRGSSVVAVGAEPAGARVSLRCRGDTEPDVALNAETLVAELLAAHWWAH